MLKDIIIAVLLLLLLSGVAWYVISMFKATFRG